MIKNNKECGFALKNLQQKRNHCTGLIVKNPVKSRIARS